MVINKSQNQAAKIYPQTFLGENSTGCVWGGGRWMAILCQASPRVLPVKYLSNGESFVMALPFTNWGLILITPSCQRALLN